MIGINPKDYNSLSAAESFVNSKGLTFTNLWDESDTVHEHYGSRNSQVWLLDKDGNRVGNSPSGFSVSRLERLLDKLE